jgi:hypothetical protein
VHERTRTIGVDLAAQPADTGVCVLVWDEHARRAHAELRMRATDDALLELIAETAPAKVGIDAPFGWPTPFVEALSAYVDADSWVQADSRRPLLLRTTDITVHELTRFPPLSVSSNFIGICAMRCAALLVRLADVAPLDRAGGGVAAEVYPAGALRQWGLTARSYEGPKPENVERRSQLVDALAAAPWLDIDADAVAQLKTNDHLIDAFVAALVARALTLRRTLPIPPEHRQTAAKEGWIHLPQAEPFALFDPFAG